MLYSTEQLIPVQREHVYYSAVWWTGFDSSILIPHNVPLSERSRPSIHRFTGTTKQVLHASPTQEMNLMYTG